MNKSLLLIVLILSRLGAARPEVTLSTLATTPRLYMISKDEDAHWRVWGQYRQDFGSVLSLQGHFEFGSENFRFRNPFRIHDMLARMILGSHTVRLGRISHWSGLVQARVDGGEYTLNTKKFGSVTFLGGFPAAADFSGTAFARSSFFLLSWGKGRPGKTLSVTAWNQQDTLETISYVGSTWNGVLLTNIGISAAMAWNVSESELHYARVSASSRVGNHRLRLGVRSKRLPVSQPYPWANEKTAPPVAVTLSVISSLATGTAWWNQLVYRVGKQPASYLSSSLNTGKLHISALAGFQGDRKLFGGGMGATRKVVSSVTAGLQLSVNAVDYGDFIDLRPASSLYGWVSWAPFDNMTARLFGQFNSNPYYKGDGRAGLAIYGTL